MLRLHLGFGLLGLFLVSAAPVEAQREPLISADDYPIEAMRSGHQGTVRYKVTIGKDGRVKHCQVIRSSGFCELDRATCSIMKRRARFTPAVGPDGSPVEDTYSSSINWSLAR